MNLMLRTLPATPSPVEIVERKGGGHPDTLCDALAEAVSVRLSRYYMERFGRVLHHNVDKVLLRGGSSRAVFGGGEVTAPIDVYLAGRATASVAGEAVPLLELAEEACALFLRAHLRYVEPRHLRLHCLLRPGSADLTDVFDRGRRQMANDTSLGVGFAPHTPLERAVLAADAALSRARAHLPAIGEDIKIMGVRTEGRMDLGIAVAFVARHLPDLTAYRDARTEAGVIAARAAARAAAAPVTAAVNMADDDAAGSVYLTVTGTSAEAGDDGEVGRGNRVGGLITPYRPMTMEAAAGKNPVTHVGKLYNALAMRAARTICEQLPEVESACCWLVSRIGHPVDEPWLIDVALRMRDGGPVDRLRPSVQALIHGELDHLPALTEAILRGEVALF